MDLNERQRRILMGILEDQRRLAGMAWDGSYAGGRVELGRHRLRVHQARQGLVPLALADWLARPLSNSDHVLCHRACVQLEAMGLLVRCNPSGGRRTTHLMLTSTGRRVAEQMLAEEYGTDDGDDAIDWANPEFLTVEVPAEPAGSRELPEAVR